MDIFEPGFQRHVSLGSLASLKTIHFALALPVAKFPPLEHEDTVREAYKFNLDNVASYLKKPVAAPYLSGKNDVCAGFIECYSDMMKINGPFNPNILFNQYRQDRGWFTYQIYSTMKEIVVMNLGDAKTIPHHHLTRMSRAVGQNL